MNVKHARMEGLAQPSTNSQTKAFLGSNQCVRGNCHRHGVSQACLTRLVAVNIMNLNVILNEILSQNLHETIYCGL